MKDRAVSRIRVARWFRARAAGWAYVGALGAAELGYALLNDKDRAAVMSWVSTNLANLRDHPVGSLAGSALVPTEYPLVWLGLAGIGLLPVARLLGNRRTVSLFVLTHLIGTGVSQGIVAWRLAAGDLPDSARHQLDTGASFIVVPALLLAVAYAPWPWRIPAAIGIGALLPYLFVGLTDLDVGAVGHATSMGVAIPLYLALRPAAPRQALGPGPRERLPRVMDAP